MGRRAGYDLENPLNVGAIVRLARRRAGLTQRELAERAGTAQAAISRLEQNAVSPTVETLEHVLRCAGAELHFTTRKAPG